jgi:pimeloyl-ACP methyl ester carboxylesterase
VSTPRTLSLPPGIRRVTLRTSRGEFAALEALPASGVRERQPALLVPGYTGSKEDFLPVLQPLAAAGRQVVAIDMRGQYETPGGDDPGAYDIAALAADVASIADQLAAGQAGGGQAGGGQAGAGQAGAGQAGAGQAGAGQAAAPPRREREPDGVHLLGHSFGGLVAREILLARATRVGSLTLMSSGPGGLTGPRAAILKAVLAEFGRPTGGDLQDEVKRIWATYLEPQAVAEETPEDILAFVRTRILSSSPTGLLCMAENLLTCPDRTQALASLGAAPLLVLYGEDDDAWDPAIQEDMALQLDAKRICIPGAAHSPAVEAPETTASTLTGFWNAAECHCRAR